jgi:hypothetical protein
MMWDGNKSQLIWSIVECGLRLNLPTWRGGRITNIRPLPPNQVAEAQTVILDAMGKGEIEQNSVIDKAVSILYLYSPERASEMRCDI